MKKILFILILTVAIVSNITGNSLAQSTNHVFQQLAQSFERADYQSISNIFDNTLEVSINHQDGTYGKQQAAAMLKDFISQHRPLSFTTKHTGTSQGQSYYAVCEMKDQMNNTWQVYLLLNTQLKIIQLKISS